MWIRDSATDCPLESEVRFGRGDFLLDRAERHPDRLFIGYETKTKATRLMLARVARLAAMEREGEGERGRQGEGERVAPRPSLSSS